MKEDRGDTEQTAAGEVSKIAEHEWPVFSKIVSVCLSLELYFYL